MTGGACFCIVAVNDRFPGMTWSPMHVRSLTTQLTLCILLPELNINDCEPDEYPSKRAPESPR